MSESDVCYISTVYLQFYFYNEYYMLNYNISLAKHFISLFLSTLKHAKLAYD